VSEILQISQEFLKINGNKQLGALLLAKLEGLLERYRTSGFLTTSEFFDVQDIIKETTQLNIRVEYIPSKELVFGIFTPQQNGHSGTSSPLKTSGSTRTKEMQEKILKSTVDLEKVKVTGAFSEVPFTLIIPEKLFTGKYTAEEITAGVLHEIGHAFFMLATLGEYTWLNYYLTDGMDVLLGKKPNKYKVELLNYDYITQHVSDDKQREKLLADPTEKNLRRAVLEACHKSQRNHLTTNVVNGAIKRNEQLADMFAMRLGFSRPLATLMDKLDREGPIGRRYTRNRTQFVAMEVIKILKAFWYVFFSVAFASLTFGLSFFIGAVLLVNLPNDSRYDRRYDNPTERLMKMRRELVTQIKDASSSPTAKLSMDEDLKAIDELLDKRNQWMSMWEAFGYMLAPGARREKDRLKHEELLETLLANDLFVQANRYNQHT
jgi:hypothetical protein